MPSLTCDIRLTKKEVTYLKSLTRHGAQRASHIMRARILLLSYEGKSNARIRESVGCSKDTVREVRKRFRERKTIQEAVQDAPRPGAPLKITPQHEAYVVATACTDPPDGHNHWTLQALQEKLTETYADLKSVSHEKIRVILLKHELKPWREKNVVRPESHPSLSRAHG